MDEFLINGKPLPLNGSTERFDITPSGEIGFECSIVAPGRPIHVAIIVVVVFFCVVLVVIVVVFVVLRRKKLKQAKAESGASHIKQNGTLSSKSNGGILDKTDPGHVRSQQDSGFTENEELNEEDIIRQHIEEELASSQVYSHQHPDFSGRANPKPDLVGPEIQGLRPGDIVLENGGVFNAGYQDEMPEHYDIDAASSIAPSDLVDVVSHYKRYRTGMLDNGKYHPHHHHHHHHHHHQNPHPHRPPPHRHTPSPGNLLGKGQDSTTSASRQSPASLSSHTSSPSSMMGCHPNSAFVRQGPLPRPPQMGKSLDQHNYNHRDRITPNSVRSTPLSGITALYPSNLSDSSQSERAPPGSRSNSRLRQPISQLGLRGTPTVGLSFDDINRLNTHDKRSPLSPTMDALSSSSEEPVRNHVNRTDFTHTDLRDPRAMMPPDSSSEDESVNDSFTISEFEYDNDRMRNDFTNPRRLVQRQAPPSGNDTDTSRSHQCRSSHDTSDTNPNDSFSTFFTSDDERGNKDGQQGLKLPPNALNLEYLLNWGPNYEHLVGVFDDIAQLPDTNKVSRVPQRRTPTPNQNHRPTTPSRAHTPSSHPPSQASSKAPTPLSKPGTPSTPLPVITEHSSPRPDYSLHSSPRHGPHNGYVEELHVLGPGQDDGTITNSLESLPEEYV